MATVLIGAYKVRQTGARGLQIQLPRPYVKEADIKAGDELEMRVNPKTPRTLILSPVGGSQKGE